MPRINQSYLNLQASYLFAEVKRRTEAFQSAHSGVRLINLGIGDVTRPLPAAVVAALETAAREQGRAETLKGYGPYVGYEWLRSEIAAHDFGGRGVKLGADEVFVSDGGKSDSANIQEIFATDCVVALMDPVYPVYADSNVMAGRTGPADATRRYPGFVYLPCTAENDFQPALPETHVDLIYLCYPNNPTGAVMTREVAIESRSYSKNAGFTGLRLAYTIVPREAQGRTADGRLVSLNQLWLRRQSTKSNGPPYVIQRAAAAVYTPEGKEQVRALIDYYMDNARLIRDGLTSAGLTVYGGHNAPYIWIRTPAGVTSWDFFDRLLAEAHVVGMPGSGFGPSGEGYFRVTAFGSHEETVEAVERIKTRLRG